MEIIDDVQPLSEKLKPRPLGPEEKAVFKLLVVGKREIGRDEPAAPELVQLSPKERVTDPFDERGPIQKTIGTYITDHKQVQNQLKPVYKAPQFIRGYCTVTADENALYERLMRSKNNISNKFRKAMGKGRDLFMLVEDTKEIADQLQLEDLRWMAETEVRTVEWAALKGIAATLNQSPDSRLHVKSYIPGVKEDLPGIKLELIQLAKLYPKQVIAASQNLDAKLKVQIFEAMNFGVLIYQDKSYFLIGPKDLVSVHTPDVDKNPVDSLIKHLTSAEGKKSYVLFAQLLNKALTPKA
jgi:hypothetical protein